MKFLSLIAAAVILSACSSPSSMDPAEVGSADSAQSSEVQADGFWEGFNGESFEFRDNGQEATITVKYLGAGECQWSIGCDPLEIGDRIVKIEISATNTGSEPLELSESMFEVEFPDGTRAGSRAGAASDYQPEDALTTQTVRPGGKYKGTLTFEAPEGEYLLVMMSDLFGGEDVAIWQM